MLASAFVAAFRAEFSALAVVDGREAIETPVPADTVPSRAFVVAVPLGTAPEVLTYLAKSSGVTNLSGAYSCFHDGKRGTQDSVGSAQSCG